MMMKRTSGSLPYCLLDYGWKYNPKYFATNIINYVWGCGWTKMIRDNDSLYNISRPYTISHSKM